MRIIGNDPKTPRQTHVVASGALSTGDTIVVNSDGTVSAVAGSPSGGGTPVTFDANNADKITAHFDSNNNKVVVAYKATGNSNYPTAVVGTVSGTSISFGTPVVFLSNNTNHIDSVFDSTNNKSVFIWQAGGGFGGGSGIVGTVSGTSISFGSSTSISPTDTNSAEFSCAFDSNAGKIAVFYTDGTNGYMACNIATVSGTSISFGSRVIAHSTLSASARAVYDSNANKVVNFYRDRNNSNSGTAVVGTISGTSVSFGTPVVFQAGPEVEDHDCVFDPSTNKIVEAWRDTTNSNYGTAIVGTVSGTSISFGTKSAFNAANSNRFTATYDPDNSGVVIAYYRTGPLALQVVRATVSGTSLSYTTPVDLVATISSSPMSVVYDTNADQIVLSYAEYLTDDGTSVTGQIGSTNLTSENFIGTAKSGAADGDGVVVNTLGAVDDTQTGLTAGQSYYVQTDGTLSTTAGDPSVFAGTAVSATKLIVKG